MVALDTCFLQFPSAELKYPIGLDGSKLENVQVSFNISYELIELDWC